MLSDSEFSHILERIGEKARNSFIAFLELMYPQEQEGQQYIIGEVHRLVANIAEDTIKGKEKSNQTLSMPPQHGKSQLVSVRFVAWCLGYKGGINIAMTGFSHTLLCDFLYDVKAITDDPRYQMIFPIKRTKDTSDVARWDNGSMVQCKSAGKKLTGRRVDLLIIDDAHAGRAEAESNTQRNKVIQWYFADCLSRLSPDAKIFIIGTRWHPQDLIGHLTEKKYVDELLAEGQEDKVFNVTNLKALADGGEDALNREAGESLFPEVRHSNFLRGIKAQTISYEWESQYQGNPTTAGSDQVDVSKLKYIESIEEIPEHAEFARGWDLAVTVQTSSDYTSGALLAYAPPTEEEKELAKKQLEEEGEGSGIALPNIYIVDMFHKKMPWSRVKSQIVELAKADGHKHNATRLGVEAVAGFKVALAEVRRSLSGIMKVEEKNPCKGGKIIRAQEWLNLIEAGNVHLLRGAWNKEFIEELRTFPDGNFDDMVDAVSIAAEVLWMNRKRMVLI